LYPRTDAWARRTLGDELWRRLAMRLCPPAALRHYQAISTRSHQDTSAFFFETVRRGI
jgi:transposase